MKKLLGIFDSKTMTPEQIFEKIQEALQDNKMLSKKEVNKKEVVTDDK